MTEDITSKLSQKGYRLTPQRMLVLAAIENSDNHITAEEIHAQVVTKYPHVNISTVYRTLELLKKLGLVMETHLAGDRVGYHPADKGHHHHLICSECGRMVDLDESVLISLKTRLLKDYGFLADLRHLAIFGRCVKCKK